MTLRLEGVYMNKSENKNHHIPHHNLNTKKITMGGSLNMAGLDTTGGTSTQIGKRGTKNPGFPASVVNIEDQSLMVVVVVGG